MGGRGDLISTSQEKKFERGKQRECMAGLGKRNIAR